MPDNPTLRGTFREIADAIREKTANKGKTKYGMTIGGLIPAVVDGALSDTDTFEFDAPEIKAINSNVYQYTFSYSPGLTRVNLPNLETVSYAFQNGFAGCVNLKSVVIDKIQSCSFVGAFSNCTSLESVNLSGLTTGTLRNAFSGCTALTSVNLDSLSSCGVNSALEATFRGCTSLTSVNLSGLTGRVGSTQTGGMNSCFRDCTSLEYVYLGNISAFGRLAPQYCFTGCINLKMVDFSRCSNCPAIHATTFSNVGSDDYKIVVPDALYSTWIAATNWSAIASHIIKKSDWDAMQ